MIYQCPYCRGRGYHYLEQGCSLTYICEDCGGSGELARCDGCGDVCAVSDINLDGLCPECAEKEENERLEKEELEEDENTLKNEKGA
jgi:RecJ-like exonuclease